MSATESIATASVINGCLQLLLAESLNFTGTDFPGLKLEAVLAF